MPKQTGPAPSGTKASLEERIKESPNASLCGYLWEWCQQATARQDRLQFVYRRALMSLLEHPHPIVQMRELERLKGIGPNIRSRLEQRLKTDAGGAASVSAPGSAPPEPAIVSASVESAPKARKRSVKAPARPYVPAYRSGPYAMLIALYLDLHGRNPQGHLTRQEIISHGQPYCALPMDEGIFSPIQGAIKTLIAKELVRKLPAAPPRYSLMEGGVELAARLWNSGERRSSAPLTPIAASPPPRTGPSVAGRSVSDTDRFEEFALAPGSFEVVLLVDTREIKSREERDFIVNRLNSAGIRSESRNLELGDFLWVAKAKPGTRT